MSTSRDSDEEDKWTTCCSGTTEKSFIKYIVQVLMGATIIVFSMVQILRGASEGKEIYFSLLSGTLGVFWPHPQIGSNNGERIRGRGGGGIYSPRSLPELASLPE